MLKSVLDRQGFHSLAESGFKFFIFDLIIMDEREFNDLSQELYEDNFLEKAIITLKAYKKIFGARAKQLYKRHQSWTRQKFRTTNYPRTFFMSYFWALGIPIVETTAYLVYRRFVFPHYEAVAVTMLGALGYDILFSRKIKKGTSASTKNI